MQQRLSGKAVVVAGGSRGIGKGVALAAAAEGAKVVIVARREGDPRFPGAMKAALQEVRDVGGEVLGIECDIADGADVKKLVADVEREFGGIDILINSAVIIHYGSMLDTTDGDWEQTFAVNTRGPFLLTREVAKAMIARGAHGHIIHLTGAGAQDVKVVTALTGATKAALERFVRGAAEELKPHGIGVSLFDPGAVKTERSLAVRGENFDWSRFIDPLECGPYAIDLAVADPMSATGQIIRRENQKEAL